MSTSMVWKFRWLHSFLARLRGSERASGAGWVEPSNAITRAITFTSPEGKAYRLNEKTAVLLARPRGWHLEERHVTVDGHPISAGLFDLGLFLFHAGRAALARALVMEPKVLLMDEPLSNLDAKLREEMRTEIRRIQKELNITSVYVTHDQIEAMTLSDRIVIMNQGIIEQIGSPVEVYRFPNSRFVSNFIGRANFVEGTVIEQNGESLIVDALGKVIHLKNVMRSFSAQDRVTLIVRPEMIRVKKQGELFEGVVQRAAYLGDVIEYDLEVQGQLMIGVETDPYIMEPFPVGETVTVGMAEGCIQVLPLEN